MIPKQPFGRSGQASSQLIFGSWAISHATFKEAASVLDLLLEYGVNHIDTAPMYGNAEKWIGAWMGGRRADLFLASKTRSRSYEGAWKNLRNTLGRLKVNAIDLWQMHGLTNPVGWEEAMGPGGALEAMLEARQQGLVRFLGVTGHGNRAAEMHLQSLARYDFDAVMLPYNYRQMQIQPYAAAFAELKRLCGERNVAMQTIKSIARRPWGKLPKTAHTYFYEPLESEAAIEQAVHWAMGLAGSFVITAGDIRLVPKMLAAAERFERQPSDAEMETLVNAYGIQPVFG
jgi:aryl-alcohol dehydrogenase-like predicted oxidoreductase